MQSRARSDRRPARRPIKSTEPLEPRVLLATFVVTSAGNAGPGSLREAITFANNSFGPDTIAFDIPGPGRAIIRPVEPLPALTRPAVIDGTTQPGWSPGNPVIELDGSAALASSEPLAGLRLDGGSTVRGLSIYHWSDPTTASAVQLTGSGNAVEGNRIGLDAFGAAGANDVGVLVAGTNNTVGSATGVVAARNVIAASTVAGVRVGRLAGDGAAPAPWRNTVGGNFIGTTANGDAAAGNATGVLLDGREGSAAEDTSVLGNVISGNVVGVHVAGAHAFGNFLDGNLIGHGAAGAAAVPNTSHGVWISGGATRNRVGDEERAAFSNRIGHNGGAGVRLDGGADANFVQFNEIGGNAGSGVFLYEADANIVRFNLVGGRAASPDAAPAPNANGQSGVTLGTFSDRNQVVDNTIAFNAGAGVSVARIAGENAVLRNRVYRNTRAGIEGGHTFRPVLRSVVSTGAATFVWGYIVAGPVAAYHVELFATDPVTGAEPGGPDAPGAVEGQRFIASIEPRTDDAGSTLFFAELPALPAGTLITATGSRVSGDALETGAFSGALPVPATPDTPRVAQVFVRSTEWTFAFLQHLQAVGLGSSRFGYAVPSDNVAPFPTSNAQDRTLPWVNLNEAFVAFTEPVTADLTDLLLVRPDGTGYRRAGFTYDAPRRVGGWTLEPQITKDRVTLRLDGTTSRAVVDAQGNKLDGDWPRLFYPSGNGAGGPDFRFEMNVLPGDADRAGERVNGADIFDVRSRVNRTASERPGRANPYTIFADVDGDGRITAADYAAVRVRNADALPPVVGASRSAVSPPATEVAPATPPGNRRVRPVGRSALAELLR